MMMNLKEVHINNAHYIDFNDVPNGLCCFYRLSNHEYGDYYYKSPEKLEWLIERVGPNINYFLGSSDRRYHLINYLGTSIREVTKEKFVDNMASFQARDWLLFNQDIWNR